MNCCLHPHDHSVPLCAGLPAVPNMMTRTAGRVRELKNRRSTRMRYCRKNQIRVVGICSVIQYTLNAELITFIYLHYVLHLQYMYFVQDEQLD